MTGPRSNASLKTAEWRSIGMSTAETLPLLRNLSPGSPWIVARRQSRQVRADIRGGHSAISIRVNGVKAHRPPHLVTVLRQKVAKVGIYPHPSHPDGPSCGISAWTPQQLRLYETAPRMSLTCGCGIAPSPPFLSPSVSVMVWNRRSKRRPIRTEAANHWYAWLPGSPLSA